MNLKKIIGIAISSLFLLTSCQKEEIYYIPLDGVKDENYAKKELSDPELNVFRDFGRVCTKAKVVPTWVEGDLICVYSIDEDNTVLFIDTCAVYGINPSARNYGKITAEVAKECLGYFASYPYDIFDYKVGDKINFGEDRNFGGKLNIEAFQNLPEGEFGRFANMSIMTSWCDVLEEHVTEGVFNFNERLSLLRINNYKNSDFPMVVSIYYKDNTTYETPSIKSMTETEMYIPISCEDVYVPQIKISYHSNSGKKYKMIYPNDMIKIGHIYAVSLK